MLTLENFMSALGTAAVDFFIKVTPPVLMFCHPLNRRPHFKLRLLVLPVYSILYGALATLIELSVLQYLFHGSENEFMLLILHLLLLLGVFFIQLFLFQGSASALLFNLLGGYAVHEICLFLFYLVFYYIPIFPDPPVVSFEYYTYHTIWFILAYLVFYHVLIKRQNIAVSGNIANNQPTLYLSLGISLFLIAFNLVRTSVVERPSTLDFMCNLCLILFYTLILLFRSGLLKTIETEKEIALTKKVWEEKEKSLTLTMDAVKTINIKYHDLKHIASRLKTDEELKEYMAEVTDSLKTYGQAISTGNDTLDMILTEQTLKFSQNSIDFSCMADGGAISFMNSIDIISLFSNALDNAYEAVLPLDKENREIYLTVKTVLGMVSICVENPCFTDPAMRDGLPVTSKRDQNYHGFGMKSIRSIVEKYNGDMTISVNHNRFKLKILLPVN